MLYQSYPHLHSCAQRRRGANLFQAAGTFAALNCTYYKIGAAIGTNELAWFFSEGQAYVTNVSKHVKVVVRMPANANAVTHYDIKSAGAWPNNNSQVGRIPRSWKLEGSSDGIRWHALHTVISNSQDNIPTVTSGGAQKWLSSNTAALGTGYGPLSATAMVRPVAVGPVSAAAGAVLESAEPIEAGGLVYDCTAGGGTITGFTLGADARVYVNGITESQLGATLPIAFAGADAYAGRRFAVTVDGVPRAVYSAYLSSAGLKVVRKGVLMIFR